MTFFLSSYSRKLHLPSKSLKIVAGASVDKPAAGIIDVMGAAGGILEFRAALLANHGFAALALPYYKYPGLPDHLSDVDLEYFQVT